MFEIAWINLSNLLNCCYERKKIISEEEATRVNDLWEDANKKIEDSKNNLPQNRIDFENGYLELKRVLNLRLKQIDKMYALESIQYAEKSKNDGWLEVLEYFGVIRKETLKLYLKNRNNIEHHDMNTVNYNEAKLEIDFIWMFLRLTDIHLANVPEYFEIGDLYDESSRKSSVSFYFEVNQLPSQKHKLVLRCIGNIQPNYLSFTENKLSIKLDDFELIDGKEYQQLINLYSVEDHQLFNRRGLFFKSTINDEELLMKILKEYLKENIINGEFTNILQRVLK